MSGSVSVVLNGESVLLPAPATVADVVSSLAPGGKGAAVAVNGEVVPRSRWSQSALSCGDQVEVVTAVQGG